MPLTVLFSSIKGSSTISINRWLLLFRSLNITFFDNSWLDWLEHLMINFFSYLSTCLLSDDDLLFFHD